MNEIDISIKKGFAPGDSLTGRVVWQFDMPQDFIVISLGWNLAGKDIVKRFFIADIQIPDPTLFGRETFSFPLPHEPYSFTGYLMNLTWHITVKTYPNHFGAEKSFALSPGRNMVMLKS